MKNFFINPLCRKAILIALIFSILPVISSAQEESFFIGSGLRIQPITERAYMHTFENSNGMVFIDQDEAIIVSTPPSDEATRDLIGWVKDTLNKEIVAYVIDRWHPDAMEGLDVVQEMGIPNYSSNLTRFAAKEKGLPLPETGFEDQLDLFVGNELIHCNYFGPAHTFDGIVVYVPSEYVLFGGNEIRNNNGWVGNIADASLDQWPETVKKIKTRYGNAKHVIPGHGPAGGSELIDYTLRLYTSQGANLPAIKLPPDLKNILSKQKIFIESVLNDSLINNIRILDDAILFVDKGEQYLRLESPRMELEGDLIRSEEGRITIGNHLSQAKNPETDGNYRRLFINLNEPVVGMTVILQELTR